MGCLDWKTRTWVLVFFVTFFAAAPFNRGFTDPRDVYAINQLYASLGSPPLPEWVPVGGDPCGPPTWQGVECVISNITGITLIGSNLGGELTDELGSFASIILINLSNNHIGGTIPSKLPTTLRSLFLSDNQFTGPIPDSISSLSQLSELSLNGNQLTGPIPDAFQLFTSLTSLDLSANNLSSILPPSMGNLPSLTTLHLQNNQLSGMLDVLQELPVLSDLNIENNMFSGPIPERLLAIPNFRREGNPFNTTPIPSPPASPPPLSPSEAPSPQSVPSAKLHGPSGPPFPEPRKRDKTTNTSHVTWFATAGLVVVVVLALGLCVFACRCCRGKRLSKETAKNHDIETYGVLNTRKQDHSPKSSFYQGQKGPQAENNEVQPTSGGSQLKTAFLKPRNDHSIDMSRLDNSTESRSGRVPLPLLPAERITADHIFSPLSSRGNAYKIENDSKLYTIASLQQYTNSFSQENLAGKGILGSVYRAQLPDGRVFAIKKLDRSASAHLSDQEFLELVSSVSKLHHPNIVELVGYCLEHGQRLLVYNYCRNGTINEALHLDDEIKKKRLSWNARMHLALQAAKALEYLHETCKPSVVHRNFKSANVLLEEDLSVRVSDCGLAPLLSPNSLIQLQGSGYGAPELELGSYSYQSDVYSFGVVMLELLTGRKSHDRSLPRSEQYLVRWAFSRLHDIDALSRMVDPSLTGAYPSKSLSRLADIISLCIQPEPEFRPPMSEIVQKLLHMIQIDR